MSRLTFPPPYRHDHAPVRNVNDAVRERLSVGQKAADWIADKVGSWEFIIGQSCVLMIWALLNMTAWVYHWDPYPFILMNLVLSLQAAYTAPMIMMSQNRKAERDRIEAHIDYEVNQTAENEIRAVLEHLESQNIAIAEIHKMIEGMQSGHDRMLTGK